MPHDVHDPGAAATFTLHCRGDVRLYRAGADCTPKSKKGRALLAVLAAEQRALPRVKIIDLLWSDRQEEQARASLRTLLADLKEQVGSGFEELLSVERERVGLGRGVRTDLTEPTLGRPHGELFEGLDHIDPELDEWLRVERGKWVETRVGSPPQLPPQGTQRRGPSRSIMLLAGALMVVAATVAGLLYYKPWHHDAAPTIAVLKFEDLTGDGDVLAEGLAEELRIQLAQHPNLQVIGRQSSEAPEVKSGNPASATKLLGATHLVEGVLLRGNPARLSIRLVDASEGRTIWNQVLPARGDILTPAPDGLAQRLTEEIAQTVESPSSESAFRADPAAYMALFKARELVLLGGPENKFEAIRLLEPVVEQWPHFAPALSVMALAIMRASDSIYAGGTIPFAIARSRAQAFAQRAIQEAPRYAPAHAALGTALRGTEDGLAELRRAAAISPGDPNIRASLAGALWTSFRHYEARPHSRAAVQLNPLRLRSNVIYLRLAAATGHHDEVAPTLSEFLRKSQNQRDKLSLMSEARALLGDPSGALVAAVQAHRLDPDDVYTSQFLWNAYVELGLSELARPFTARGSLADLVLARDVKGVAAYVRKAGPSFWSMSEDTAAAAELLISSGKGDELVRAYDHANKNIQNSDFSGYGPLIVALRDARRETEANKLLSKFSRGAREISQRGNTPFSSLLQAQAAGLSGDCDGGVRILDRQFREVNLEFLFDYLDKAFDRVAYRCMRGKPAFEALRAKKNALVSREQREAIEELKQAAFFAEARQIDKASQRRPKSA